MSLLKCINYNNSNATDFIKIDSNGKLSKSRPQHTFYHGEVSSDDFEKSANNNYWASTVNVNFLNNESIDINTANIQLTAKEKTKIWASDIDINNYSFIIKAEDICSVYWLIIVDYIE